MMVHCLPSDPSLVLIQIVAFMKNPKCITLIAKSPTTIEWGSNPFIITQANIVILIIIEPTLDFLENPTSFKDRIPIWFLKLMINYQNDLFMLHLFSQKILTIHLQQEDLEMQLVRTRRFVHLSCLIGNYYLHTISNSRCMMSTLMFLPLKVCPQLEIIFQFPKWINE